MHHGAGKPITTTTSNRPSALALLAVIGVLAGCHGTSDAPYPTVSEPVVVVPSAGLPPGVVLQKANNNLDAVFHEGRYFLAFRTAPTHFAGTETVLYVVSSTDRRRWAFEASFSECRDLREPRLLSFDGRLFLYYALLGTNPLGFEPGGMRVTERFGQGDWTPAEAVYEPGFIPWRTKTVDGIPYMLAYEGGRASTASAASPSRYTGSPPATAATGRRWCRGGRWCSGAGARRPTSSSSMTAPSSP